MAQNLRHNCAKDRADVLGESVDETAYVKRNHHCGLAARVFGAWPLRAALSCRRLIQSVGSHSPKSCFPYQHSVNARAKLGSQRIYSSVLYSRVSPPSRFTVPSVLYVNGRQPSATLYHTKQEPLKTQMIADSVAIKLFLFRLYKKINHI